MTSLWPRWRRATSAWSRSGRRGTSARPGRAPRDERDRGRAGGLQVHGPRPLQRLPPGRALLRRGPSAKDGRPLRPQRGRGRRSRGLSGLGGLRDRLRAHAGARRHRAGQYILRKRRGGEMNSGPSVAGAPISWGVIELPNWGYQMPADRLLREAASVGLTAMEAGPGEFLPQDPPRGFEILAEHSLGLVGGFFP